MAGSQDTRDLYPQIGRFIVEYAITQKLMKEALLIIAEAETKGGSLLVHGIADRALSRKLQTGLENRKGGFREFCFTLKCLRKVTDFRDKLVHFSPRLSSDKSKILRIEDAYRDFNQANQPGMKITSLQLEKLSIWLEVANLDLNHLIDDLRNENLFDVVTYTIVYSESLPPIPDID